MDSDSSSNIKVSLVNEEIWKEFYPNTEMVLIRKKGRLLFPHLNYIVKGLYPDNLYSMFLHFERVDRKKYKFERGKWIEVGEGNPVSIIEYKEHPSGICSGYDWMKKPLSFAHLRITNDLNNKDADKYCLYSLHKYIPVLTIRKFGEVKGEEFRYKITQFFTVTTYQSQDMIDLKKIHNKHSARFQNDKRDSIEAPEIEEEPKKKQKINSSPQSNSSNLQVSNIPFKPQNPPTQPDPPLIPSIPFIPSTSSLTPDQSIPHSYYGEPTPSSEFTPYYHELVPAIHQNHYDNYGTNTMNQPYYAPMYMDYTWN